MAAGTRTLVVQSSDFSHFLPPHQAWQRDQETLNVLASGDLDAIARLNQPDHIDCVGCQYVQTSLQRGWFGSRPLVLDNRNSWQYAGRYVAETTSYVILFGVFIITVVRVFERYIPGSGKATRE